MAVDQRTLAAAAAIAALVVTFAAACLVDARTHSLCNDEAKHLVTGFRVLERRECCLGGDNAPLTALFALPAWVAGATPLPGLKMGDPVHEAGHAWLFRQADPERVLFAARCLAIVLGVGMLVGIAALAWRHFGPLGAFAGVAAAACDPTVLGHFSLVSTDALVAAAVIGCLAALDWWSAGPSPVRATGVGIALGLAFLAKFTAVAFGPAVVLWAWLHRRQVAAPRVRSLTAQAVACAVAAATTVWLGYGGHLSPRFPFFTLPGLATGLEQSRIYAVGGMPSFFCGWLGRCHPGYFWFAPLVKLPIPLLALWSLAAVVVLLTPVRKSPLAQVAALAAACLFTAFAASRLCIGIRHLLPAFTLTALVVAAAAGAVPRLPALPRRIVACGIAGLLAWLAAEAAWTAPRHLSYFNQFAGGPRGGIHLLGDSNLDWGQDLKTLKKTMTTLGLDEVILSYFGNTDPAFYGIRYQYLPKMLYAADHGDHVVDPRREVLAISVNNLQGTFLRNPNAYAWLHDREPFATAGDSIWLFDITGDAEAHARLQAIYWAAGCGRLAAAEAAKHRACARGDRRPDAGGNAPAITER